MARDQNTFAKRQREMEKKRKAEEKRERRRKKKEQADAPPEGVPSDSSTTEQEGDLHPTRNDPDS
ncbi:MAG TPA: hypothetical protein QF761_08855 [Pirellulales bacterium]|nr:hypothetical protein [Pirellulales bacterium]